MGSVLILSVSVTDAFAIVNAQWELAQEYNEPIKATSLLRSHLLYVNEPL